MEETHPAIMYLVRRAHRYGYAALDFYKSLERMSYMLHDGKIPSFARIM